jgi:hypothetical protein
VGSTIVSTCVLVLGMHRSGTSMLSGLVGHLGAALPASPMPPTDFNPAGFFESEAISKRNEALLRELGQRWFDPRIVTAEQRTSEPVLKARTELVALYRQEFRNSAITVLKDPRICKLMPLWRDILRDVGATPLFVIALRHPLEVANSLSTRNGFSPEETAVLWMRHVLEAERGSRGQDRMFVLYDDVMRDWRPFAATLRGRLGLGERPLDAQQVAAIERHVRQDLRHHAQDEAAEGRLPPRAMRVWDGLLDLARDDANIAARSALDRELAWLDEASGLFGGVIGRLLLPNPNQRPNRPQAKAG